MNKKHKKEKPIDENEQLVDNNENQIAEPLVQELSVEKETSIIESSVSESKAEPNVSVEPRKKLIQSHSKFSKFKTSQGA